MLSKDLGVHILWSSFMIYYGACLAFLDVNNHSPHSLSFTLLYTKHSHLFCVPHKEEHELVELTL